MRRGLALLLFGFCVASLFVSGLAGSSSSSSSSEDEDDEGSEQEGWTGERIDGDSFRLERLEARLNAIKDRLDSSDDNGDNHVLDLKTRLNNIEGDGCGDAEFACGRNARMCIASNLCCDGVDDCPDAQDESADVCKNRAAAGSSFSGRVHWDGCMTVSDSDITISITGNNRYDYFPSRIWVEGNTVYGSDNEQHSFNSKGYYDFGLRTFELANQDFVNSKCTFIDDDVIECNITGTGGSACATVRLSRD